MEVDEHWEKRCKVWAYPDGSLYSNTATAPPPSKNFLQIFVSSNQVILRIWKIIPPTRADSNQPPYHLSANYVEFLEDEKMRGEIERNLGIRELEYVQMLTHKEIDYLARIPTRALMNILFCMDLVSIAKLGQVNKLFRELCKSEVLWQRIYMVHSRKQPTQELLMLVDTKGWKEVFFMNKLQLQMQMRRTTKESSPKTGSVFLTATPVTLPEEDYNTESPFYASTNKDDKKKKKKASIAKVSKTKLKRPDNEEGGSQVNSQVNSHVDSQVSINRNENAPLNQHGYDFEDQTHSHTGHFSDSTSESPSEEADNHQYDEDNDSPRTWEQYP